MLVVTEQIRRILAGAAGGCGCESYYNYHCSWCSLIAHTDSEIFRKLVSDGLLCYHDYSGYKLTEKGKELYKQLNV